MRLFITLIIMFVFIGCQSAQKVKHVDIEPFEYRFEKTKEKNEAAKQDRAFTVLRLPPVVKAEILEAIKQSCSIEEAIKVTRSMSIYLFQYLISLS